MAFIEHHELNSLHPSAYNQATEPTGSLIRAGIEWNDTSTSPITRKVRNSSNSGWNIIGGGGSGTATDVSLAITDVVTNDVSTAKHGFAPKLPNDALKFLNGIGTYTIPAGGPGGTGTVWRNGDGPPPTNHADGDYWLNNLNGDVYKQLGGPNSYQVVANIKGAKGIPAYIYIAYADDANGTGFTTTFSAAKNYIAIKTSAAAINAPAAADFAGLWKNYQGAAGTGSGTSGVLHTDTTSIRMLGTGVAPNELQASAVISPDTGNSLAARLNGLFAASGSGAAGPQGAAGTPGAVWRNGDGPPPTNHANGDYWLNNLNGDVYKQTNGNYGVVANIKGAAGAQGPQGIQGATGPAGSGTGTGTVGPAGAPGAVWRAGSGAPPTNNVDGDFWLNNLNGDVYRQTSGSYSVVANIKGATGAQGPQGIQGATGPAGSGTGTSTFATLGGAAADNASLTTYVQSKAGMPVVNLGNYISGGGTTAQNTAAIDSWIAALRPGTRGYVPDGMWQTNGGHTMPQGIMMEGGSQRTTGFRSMLAGTSLFKIQSDAANTDPQWKNNVFSDMRLESVSTTGTSLILLTGMNPIFNVVYNRCWFKGAGVGVDYYPTSGTDMEVENMVFNEPIFDLNSIGYRSNSVNNSVIFNTPFSYVPDGGIAYDVLEAGYLEINSHHTIGTLGSAYSPVTGRVANGTTFIRSTNVFNTIRVNGGQDERMEFFLNKAGGAFTRGGFIVEGGTLVQSKVFFGAAMTFITHDNLYVCGPTYGTFEDVPGAGAGIISANDYFLNRPEAGGSDLATHNATRWSAGSVSDFITRSDRGSYIESRNRYQRDVLDPLLANAPEYNSRATNFVNKKQPVRSIVSPDGGRPQLELIEANGHGMMVYRDAATGVIHLVSTQPQIGWAIDGRKLVFNADGTVTHVAA